MFWIAKTENRLETSNTVHCVYAWRHTVLRHRQCDVDVTARREASWLRLQSDDTSLGASQSVSWQKLTGSNVDNLEICHNFHSESLIVHLLLFGGLENSKINVHVFRFLLLLGWCCHQLYMTVNRVHHLSARANNPHQAAFTWNVNLN